jgi:DNA-binding transcriptional LysR family regulator
MYIAPIMFGFLRANPSVQIRSLLVDRVVDLHEESIDVAIRIAAMRDSSLRATRVGQVVRVLCAAPGYLKAHGVPRRPSDLRKHQVVMFAAGSPPGDWSFSHGRKTQRVALTPTLVTNSTEVSLQAGITGLGIVRALSYQVADDVAAGRLVRILTRYEPSAVPIQVVHTHGLHPSLRVRVFVDYVVSALRSDQRLRSMNF